MTVTISDRSVSYLKLPEKRPLESNMVGITFSWYAALSSQWWLNIKYDGSLTFKETLIGSSDVLMSISQGPGSGGISSSHKLQSREASPGSLSSSKGNNMNDHSEFEEENDLQNLIFPLHMYCRLYCNYPHYFLRSR
ncbi:hypothetical protein PsorP6_004660 [Peronosclerospora sorghi]|uniref:Uncharacterized protein n=1 Tax=Peronosclerospora sorghi TaxID=230839 RepID=A0ACC0VNU7_9STRA|nr:hypothetical protein PsorP6_004660 [Peronosclerospora sorghi]